jgi:hypothetical protein
MTEILGVPPFSGGWAEQPEALMLAIAALKSEARAMESEAIRNAGKK